MKPCVDKNVQTHTHSNMYVCNFACDPSIIVPAGSSLFWFVVAEYQSQFISLNQRYSYLPSFIIVFSADWLILSYSNTLLLLNLLYDPCFVFRHRHVQWIVKAFVFLLTYRVHIYLNHRHTHVMLPNFCHTLEVFVRVLVQ